MSLLHEHVLNPSVNYNVMSLLGFASCTSYVSKSVWCSMDRRISITRNSVSCGHENYTSLYICRQVFFRMVHQI